MLGTADKITKPAKRGVIFPRLSAQEEAGLIIGSLLTLGFAATWATGLALATISARSLIVPGFIDTFQMLLAWPANITNPANAWPARIGAYLPSGLAYYAATLIIWSPIILLSVRIIRKRHADGKSLLPATTTSTRQVGGARWAKHRDVKDLLVTAPNPKRYILGRYHKHLLASRPQTHLCVVAGTRVGKTTSVVIPILLEHEGPVIATSVKADLVDATIKQRQRIAGKKSGVMVFDPAGISSYESACWSPIYAAMTWREAQATAASLTEAGITGGGENDAYWKQTSASLISVLLHAAAVTDRGMRGALTWLNTLTTSSEEERLDIYRAIEYAMQQGAPKTIEEKFRAFCGEDKKTQANQVSMVKSILGVYENEDVLRLADSDTPITYQRLVEGNNTLFLIAPPAEQLQYKAVFSSLIEHLIDQGMKDGRALDPPLCVMLEEAGNVAPLPKLPTYLSTSAGLGITFCTIWQSVSQIKETYGDNGIGTVLENSGGLIVLGNIRDTETINRLASMVGEEMIEQTNTSKSHDGTHSTSTSQSRQNLIIASTIREQKMGEGILVLENRPPIKLKMRQYFDDPHLKKLAGLTHDAGTTSKPQKALKKPEKEQLLLPPPSDLDLPPELDRLLRLAEADYQQKTRPKKERVA